MDNIINRIKKELKHHVDLKYKDGATNFFKEDIVCYGVRTPVVRKIANKYWPEIKKVDKKKIFSFCEELLKNNYCEEATIAFSWTRKLKNQFTEDDFPIFERWLKKYVDNWAKCDDFCTHSFNYLLYKNPDLYPKVKLWTKSKNRWMRRSVSVIHITTEKKFYVAKNLKHIFEIADILLMDKDDLVQKGYGWMLKVASDHSQKQVFDFVMKRKNIMPRTALRYAIEKMPANLKKQAMN
ncbi:DNA alkylation repair protein [Patescibacteria group bacterium]|nr:DNA alkylation repair protein [Patescibacteria group bacterium]MBU1895586.1 DNA alkylation repair protein [Patescibacteria group bacterium]